MEEQTAPADVLLESLLNERPEAAANGIQEVLKAHMAKTEEVLRANALQLERAASEQMKEVTNKIEAFKAELLAAREENKELRRKLGMASGETGSTVDDQAPGAMRAARQMEDPSIPGTIAVDDVGIRDPRGGIPTKESNVGLPPRQPGDIEPRQKDDSECSENNSDDEGDRMRQVTMLNKEDEALKDKIRATLSYRGLTKSEIQKENIWALIVNNFWFENGTVFLIALNSLWIAWETDHVKEDAVIDNAPEVQVIQHLFCLAFSVELLCRFLSFRRTSYIMKDAWFVFDATLLSMMILEVWVMSLVVYITRSLEGHNSQDTGGSSDWSVLRILRLVRMTRTARVMKILRFFPELMVMVRGLTAATRSVCVTLSLLCLIIYIFGIAFTQMMANTHVGDTYFFSVPTSMNALIAYGIFMEDAPIILNELRHASLIFYFSFLIFALLASWTVLNMLIGVMVETVRRVSTMDREQRSLAECKEKLLSMLENSGLDADGDHRISKSEFAALLEVEGCAKALSDVGVDPLGLVDLSDFIFAKQADLEFHEFMEVVMCLRGDNIATVKDLVDLRKFVAKEILGMRQCLDFHLAGPSWSKQQGRIASRSRGSTSKELLSPTKEQISSSEGLKWSSG